MRKSGKFKREASACIEGIDILIESCGETPKTAMAVLRSALTDEPNPERPRKKGKVDAWLRGKAIRSAVATFIQAVAGRDVQFFSDMARIFKSKTTDTGIDNIRRAIAVQGWFDYKIRVTRTRPEFQALVEDLAGEKYHRQSFVRVAEKMGAKFIKAKRGPRKSS